MATKKVNAGKSISKTQVIREALAKGIESPAEISAYAKQSKGMEIEPKYVSVIKSQLKAKKSLVGLARIQMGRDLQKEAMIFALRSGTIEKAKKSLDEVRNNPVLAFAAQMGGVDKAIAALDAIASQLGSH